MILVRVDRGGAIGVIGRGGGDAEDDAVAVLDLEGEGFSWRAVLDRYAEWYRFIGRDS